MLERVRAAGKERPAELEKQIAAAVERATGFLSRSDDARLFLEGAILGDLAVTVGPTRAAERIQAAVLEAYERTHPEDSMQVLGSRIHLATTRFDLGDLEGARILRSAPTARAGSPPAARRWKGDLELAETLARRNP